MNNFRLFPLALALSSGLFLAACESDEEKAERHFQSGLALLEEGDEDRALVELRNVFKYDGFHKEARQIYADTVFKMGGIQEAYGQYLRLIEQHPDTIEVRRQLAEIAISRGDWKEAERHAKAAIALTPDAPNVKALELALIYREASLGRDAAARAVTAREAAALLEDIRANETDDNLILVRIVIDHLVASDTPGAALPAIDEALARNPQALDLNMLRVRLLAQSGDTEGTGVQLKKMVEMFPEDQEIQQALINWYLVQEDIDGAETFLRQLAGPDTGPTEGHINVVQLLQAGRGAAAAREELERLIAANENTENGMLYSGMLAAMTFEMGEYEKGIADLRAALEGAEPGDQTRDLQIMLAQMLDATEDRAAARALVEAVLEDDASHVDALKMQAAWLIDEDRPGEAIVALRRALNQSPQDPQTLTLMAQAHERDGDTELTGERLALAVEVSGSGVPESIRYARFLIAQERLSVAATVLEDARRRAPLDLNLLSLLADIRLQTREWQLAQGITQQLREIETPESRQIAAELQARILQGQDRTEDSLAVLEAQIGENAQSADSQSARTIALLVQTQIRSGKFDAARITLDDALSEAPNNPQLQLLDASLNAVMGDMKAAESGYRNLIKLFPESALPIQLLMSVLVANDRREEALGLLDSAIARMPKEPTLLWMKAGMLEQDEDFDGAIAVYEDLYAQDSSNMIIANNLASMLGTYRDDPESLQRAATISRRLRGTKVPAFQDTYGWIAFRRNDLEEAVNYLEPAAAALEQDPLVQYHLGMALAALERNAAAKEALTQAVEIAGDSPLPQFQTARDTLKKLEAEAATSKN